MSISDLISGKTRSETQVNNHMETRGPERSTFFGNMASKAERGTAVKAYKFSSPVKYDQPDEARKKAMNNDHLNARSEIFIDDSLQSVEKRCFFLMCGKQSNIGTSGAITVDAVINAFDDPAMKKKMTLAVALDNIIIEYNSEILKSFT